MPRPRRFDPATERYIGRVCVRARRRGIAWKVIALRFEIGRKKLWQLWRFEIERAARKDVSKHLSAGHPAAASAYRAAELSR